MIILDENIPGDQRKLVQVEVKTARQVGFDIENAGLKDHEIPRFLLRLKNPTFFSLDDDFYDKKLRHQKYCIVYLDVAEDEAATYAVKLLRHKNFDTHSKRMGKVIQVSTKKIKYWHVHDEMPSIVMWGNTN